MRGQGGGTALSRPLSEARRPRRGGVDEHGEHVDEGEHGEQLAVDERDGEEEEVPPSRPCPRAASHVCGWCAAEAVCATAAGAGCAAAAGGSG